MSGAGGRLSRKEGRVGPKLVLAIGPNYVWEFLRLAWNLGYPVLGGAGVIYRSVLLSSGIALVAFVRGIRLKKVEREEGR